MEDKTGLNTDNINSQERLVHTPNIKYKFYFSPHGNPNDFKDLFGLIKNADIYIPEVYSWSKEYLEIYQDVSAGKKTPKQTIKELHYEDSEMNRLLLEELQVLYDTKKPVIFIDLPEEEAPHAKNKIWLGARDFEGLLSNVKHYLEEESKLNHRREEYMVGQLKTKVGEIIDTNPDLRTKGDVNVLVSLGSVHTGVYYELRESGERAEREFNVMPQVYSLGDEGVRRYMWEKPVDQELLAQILLEKAFGEVFQLELEKVSTDNTKIELFKRKVASQFGIDEIKDIFRVLTYTDWNFFKRSFEGHMVYLMEEKGLKLPESEDELQNIIKKNGSQSPLT